MQNFTILPHEAKQPWRIKTPLKGSSVFKEPLLNKDTAFSDEERRQLGLTGLIPMLVESLPTQIERAWGEYQKCDSDLDRHVFLRALQDRNETLFYAIVREHGMETIPMIYTPVVGEACQKFHKIWREPRGLILSYAERDRMDEIFASLKMPHLKFIVVTDGERILGLGDQGMGGMGIPIGKISLYTACGGLHPAYGLPVVLDVGTNNQERLNDPHYLGWKHARITDEEYHSFINQFVQTVKKYYPNVLLQWEDFAKDNARPLLDRYRDELCSFNDDIQGTAAVTLAGLLSAIHVVGNKITDHRVVIYGAGSAGTGIADYIVETMVDEGMSLKDARDRVWILNSKGLLQEGQEGLADFQLPYAKSKEALAGWTVVDANKITLKETVANAKPTILIGVATVYQAFTEEIVKEMAAYTERPIIFPLSNPFSKCEASPEDLLRWTNGKALVATGTRFDDVAYGGKTYVIGQCNNYYIFPALGLALVACDAKRVTDEMCVAAAKALSELSPALKNPTDSLFPSPKLIFSLAKPTALAVAIQGQKEGHIAPCSVEELQKKIDNAFWDPAYPEIIPQEDS